MNRYKRIGSVAHAALGGFLISEAFRTDSTNNIVVALLVATILLSRCVWRAWLNA